MIAGLPKYAHGQVRQRASSPKLQVLNAALMTAQSGRSPADARRDGDYWGRLVESCVGAHLLNTSMGGDIELSYWRDRNQEVDFVPPRGKTAVAIEVKSGRPPESLTAMEAFGRQFKPWRKLLIGGQGIPLEEFLTHPAEYWLQQREILGYAENLFARSCFCVEISSCLRPKPSEKKSARSRTSRACI